MSAAAPTATDASAPAKPKSKKLLFIILGVVVLAVIGAAAALFVLQKNTAEGEEGEEEAPVAQQSGKPKVPPTFLPLDNMVVNLADPGGNRFVQLGITLQLQDAATSDSVKAYMPSVRSGILMLISQRTAEEMLQVSGKEKLSNDIITEISLVMDYELDEAEPAAGQKKRRRAPPNPVQAVLFSSFIVQ